MPPSRKKETQKHRKKLHIEPHHIKLPLILLNPSFCVIDAFTLDLESYITADNENLFPRTLPEVATPLPAATAEAAVTATAIHWATGTTSACPSQSTLALAAALAAKLTTTPLATLPAQASLYPKPRTSVHF